MINISISIVLYKNEPGLLRQTIASVLRYKNLKLKLFLVDNSPDAGLSYSLKDLLSDARIEYIHTNNNIGFGAGHNIAIKKTINDTSYHLVLNPDVTFSDDVLVPLINYLDNNKDVGVVMPKVMYDDNSIQHLAKLLPRPFDFFVIRFLPFAFKKSQDNFKLKQSGYNKTMMVPFLSGCFLIFRTEALKKAGLFDEKIFMYTEDIDITRRIINASYKPVFFPDVHIYHHHEKKSFKNFKVFKTYLKSTIYYFNKWGWFFDKERVKINKATLNQLK